jgi:hypothetical protein
VVVVVVAVTSWRRWRMHACYLQNNRISLSVRLCGGNRANGERAKGRKGCGKQIQAKRHDAKWTRTFFSTSPCSEESSCLLVSSNRLGLCVSHKDKTTAPTPGPMESDDPSSRLSRRGLETRTSQGHRSIVVSRSVGHKRKHHSPFPLSKTKTKRVPLQSAQSLSLISSSVSGLLASVV